MKYLTAILILLSATAWGQQSSEKPKRTAYEEALLDSAYRYEELKIANAHLSTAYEYKSKEATAIREALRLSELQSAVQKTYYERQIADIPRKQWRKGFKAGAIAGAVAFAIAAAIIKGVTK